ncbi:thiol-disulfide oxidoreductase DCC family protein [Aliikangiella maris]|uniref:Thiol-disulfide oxidoreductase DCC family protein n=2 Tax=Aliikangiella maris TaxID=3162458 RepID=A0ABV3MQK1_9GAMM
MNQRLPEFISPDDKVILFDDVCHLCNGWSRFIIKNDRSYKFKLVSVQSDKGQQLLKYFGFPTDRFDTMIYIENGQAFEKSSAFFNIIFQLAFPYKLLIIFKIIPRFMRDSAYDWFARNRYRFFGKSDHCLLPSSENQKHFL